MIGGFSKQRFCIKGLAYLQERKISSFDQPLVDFGWQLEAKDQTMTLDKDSQINQNLKLIAEAGTER